MTRLADEHGGVVGKLNVHAGTYTETVTISKNNLTFQANSGETPTLSWA